MTLLVRVAWLTAIWIALWSELSVANVLSGLLVAAAVVVVFDTRSAGRVVVRPLAAARFVVHFVVRLMASTAVVARTVVAPRHRIRTGIVAVPLRGCTDAVATLIADAISLTPGTLTVEVGHDPLTLYVHALDVRDTSAVRDEVRTLEILAIRAFGDADAIAGLATDDTSIRRTS
jgi:multicomponent Na+:H+ antiporter subunit E